MSQGLLMGEMAASTGCQHQQSVRTLAVPISSATDPADPAHLLP
jgi:hypothetical protein